MDQNKQVYDTHEPNTAQDWDPKTMLNNLLFMEKKIHKLRESVHFIVERRGQLMGQPDGLLVQQQHLITADLTSVIVQLISTAGSLLPSVNRTLSSTVSENVTNPSAKALENYILPQSNGNKVENQPNQTDVAANFVSKQIVEDHEMKSDDEADEGENLPPGSYEILQLEKEEILAPHTHFCTICGKGFKRDANLRMHMRGHGDEYKTAAALAKPNKGATTSDPIIMKRYSCPCVGCKRNKDHKKFQPLKTILCVKNHYKRTHCDKNYTCSRCKTKKFSVLADLKTHEKHCGQDKWLCSCGTTFSRKDKLFGHVALFQGHVPVVTPFEESKGSVTNKVEELEFGNCMSEGPSGTGFQNAMDFVKGSAAVDPTSYFSPLSYDSNNSLGGFLEFPPPSFGDSESSFSFMFSGSSNRE